MEKIWFKTSSAFFTNLADRATTALTPTPGILHIELTIPREDDNSKSATLYIPMTGTVATELLESLRLRQQQGGLATPPNLGGSGRIQ